MSFFQKLFSKKEKTPTEHFLEAFNKRQYPLAVELSKRVEIESDSGLANRIAIAYQETKDYEVAFKYYKMVAAIERRKGKVMSSTLDNIAKMAYVTKDWNEVIKTIQQFDASWFKEVDRHNEFELVGMLGTAFQNLNMYQQAIDTYKGASLSSANLSENQRRMLKYTAHCYEMLGNKKQALNFYQKYLKHDFSDEIIHKIKELS